MKRHHTHTQPHLLLFALASCGMLCLLFSGCVPVDFGSFKESYVTIRPEGSVHSLPPMQYHFYSDRDTLILHPCDGRGNYEGHLPIGIYNVIATNTNTNDVIFRDLQSCERASVHAVPESAAARSGEQVFRHAGPVYTVPLSGVQVNGRDSVSLSPHPVLLTKRVRLRVFLLETLEEEVHTVNGVLCGVQPSASLFSCLTRDAENPSASTVRFTTEPVDEARQGEVTLFGLTHPGYGEVYENILRLTLEKDNGEAEETEIDMASILSWVIDENEGDLPLYLSLKIDIRKTPIGVKAEVSSWEYSGSGTGEIEPIDNGQLTMDN